MLWNWQQPDWPDFSWNSTRLEEAERIFLQESGVSIGTLKHQGSSDREELMIESISTEALSTSEIENEFLDRASVQSSIRKHFGLASGKSCIGRSEQGIADLMVDLYRNSPQALSGEVLFNWHMMLLGERTDLKDLGRYRTSPEPMQIVSGSFRDPKLHFEAPPSAILRAEMSNFIKWFNRTAPGGASPLPALTRSGIAHLYFECIHPFEDGNGRLGRAIAEKALAQGIGQPTLIGLSATILEKRKAYYTTLAAANKGNEITQWLKWFAATAIEAQRRSIARVEFLIQKARLLDRLRGQLNPRQEKAILRMLREGPAGFAGGLSASSYATITGASPASTTRDLADLVAKAVLKRTGELRHTRYYLKIRHPKAHPFTFHN